MLFFLGFGVLFMLFLHWYQIGFRLFLDPLKLFSDYPQIGLRFSFVIFVLRWPFLELSRFRTNYNISLKHARSRKTVLLGGGTDFSSELFAQAFGAIRFLYWLNLVRVLPAAARWGPTSGSVGCACGSRGGCVSVGRALLSDLLPINDKIISWEHWSNLEILDQIVWYNNS